MPPPQLSRWVGARFLLAIGGPAVAVVALLLSLYLRKSSPATLWTIEELRLYNGTDARSPILLAILGSVFDVSNGRSHYGSGGGYHHFSGRDASRAFLSGNFSGDGLTDSLQGLTSLEVNSVVNWRQFYFNKYKYVGKLVGRYYDDHGNPTKHLKAVEAKAKRGAQLQEKQKIEEEKIPSCNSKWSQDDGGEVWCDSGYPRLMTSGFDAAAAWSPTGATPNRRCACVEESDLGRPGLQIYDGCDYYSKACSV